jgi:hypothetical protein
MANKNSEILSAVKSAGEAALRLHEDNKSMRERLRSTQNPGLAVRQQAADALKRLTAENAALRKDAERYRWLRVIQHPSLGLTRLVLNDTPYGIDAAIDAAMGEKP